MDTLPLTPDELLSTTRAVRKRLDLQRPVEQSIIEECLTLAQQAPRASNIETRHFVIVTVAERKAALAELWRRGMSRYVERIRASGRAEPEPGGTQSRIMSGVEYLGEHLHEVPVLLIPCVRGRVDGTPLLAQSGAWGTIAPAIWSFMLAARARGLGTCWTSFHLPYEREAAEILGIPYDQITQTALVPVAYSLGTDFKPGPRESLSTIAHWESW